MLRCARNDVNIASRSRGMFARGLHLVCPPRIQRGRREDRVLAAPAVSRAICAKQVAHEHTGQLEHSGLPCAMGLRLISCSPRSGRARCHRRPREVFPLANLTPASGRQDHTTSPYASGAHVYRAIRVHRIPPHVRDDRERPSMGETGGVMPLIWPAAEAKNFCAAGWTQHLADLPTGQRETSPAAAVNVTRGSNRAAGDRQVRQDRFRL